MSAGRKEQIKAMQRWGYPGDAWPGRDNCTAWERARNISVLSKPSLSSPPPAKQQCISRRRPLSLISRQSNSHWLSKSSYFISHRACAQHCSVTRYPAGTDKSKRVWDTNLCFLDAAQPSPSPKGPPHRICASKGLHSFLYCVSRSKGNTQQRLGHKPPYSCSFKWRIFLSVRAVFSISLFMS